MQQKLSLALWALSRPRPTGRSLWHPSRQQARSVSTTKGKKALPGAKTVVTNLIRPIRKPQPRQDPVQSERSTAPVFTESRGQNGERIVHLPHVIYQGDTNVIELPDGRIMSFAMGGRLDPKRKMIPLVFETGTPGTRLDGHSFNNWGWRNFVPIITPDRPGNGHTTLMKKYTVASHAEDVRFLLHALGYRKYRVYGVSGGGPFVLSMAAGAPKGEVLCTGIMAGAAPAEASHRGGITFRGLWLAFCMAYFPHWMEQVRRKQLKRLIPSVNLDGSRIQPTIREDTKEARKLACDLEKNMGYRGYVAYWSALYRYYWGFELETLRDKIPVHMVYGTKDKNTPLGNGLYMQERIGGDICKLKVVPGGDHYSTQDAETIWLLNQLLKYK